MRRVVPIILLCALLPLHAVSLRYAAQARKALPQGREEAAYAIPGPILKITSLEFDGLASDLMFLRALVFYGSTYERKEKPRVKDWEWQRLYRELTAATDLDPYFRDPYYFAEGTLPWDGHLVNETNLLLEKGSKFRDWDWLMPFYVGFNHFYFLQDNAQASTYLMEASKRPGSSVTIASLATRLAVKGDRTETAIVFLEQLLTQEKDEEIKKEYKVRLKALKGIWVLEKAVASYNASFGKPPASLNALVERRLLRQIPVDPYGGTFYLDEDGAVKTTSDLRHKEDK
ncbi:MAG: hypothetical protein CXR31_14880 [Geobacter sp.]|nr:MAG: hypothetical protein CXR31_14880 [Geobacter sp.]